MRRSEAQSAARECGHSCHAWHRAMRRRYGRVFTAGQFVPFDRHGNLLPPRRAVPPYSDRNGAVGAGWEAACSAQFVHRTAGR